VPNERSRAVMTQQPSRPAEALEILSAGIIGIFFCIALVSGGLGIAVAERLRGLDGSFKVSLGLIALVFLAAALLMSRIDRRNLTHHTRHRANYRNAAGIREM
jgi:hypothetical protein